MKTRIQYCDGVKETILHEDKDYRFLVTTHNESTYVCEVPSMGTYWTRF